MLDLFSVVELIYKIYGTQKVHSCLIHVGTTIIINIGIVYNIPALVIRYNI